MLAPFCHPLPASPTTTPYVSSFRPPEDPIRSHKQLQLRTWLERMQFNLEIEVEVQVLRTRREQPNRNRNPIFYTSHGSMMDSIPAKTRTRNRFPIAFCSTVETREIRAFGYCLLWPIYHFKYLLFDIEFRVYLRFSRAQHLQSNKIGIRRR